MATTTTWFSSVWWRARGCSRFAPSSTTTTTRRTVRILANREFEPCSDQGHTNHRLKELRRAPRLQVQRLGSTPSGMFSTATPSARAWSSAAVDHPDEQTSPSSSSSSSSKVVVPFLLADIGEGIQEVEVLKWSVRRGDKVQEFDTLCQVQSDKATVDITSRFAGTIVDICPDTKIQVGQPLVHIETTTTQTPQKGGTAAAAAFSSPSSSSSSKQMNNKNNDKTSSSSNSSSSSSSNSPALSSSKVVVPFLLADIGEGIQEVEVLQWYVQVGDEVQEFDTICQVQSDKATVDITSRFAGTVVGISPHYKVAVGEPLVHIETKSSSMAAAGAAAVPDPAHPTALERQQHEDHNHDQHHHHPNNVRLQIPSVASHYALDADAPPPTTTTTTIINDAKYLASPAVRKLAADHQINVRAIQGTGPQGRVLKADLLQYITKQRQRQDPQQPMITPPTVDTSTQHPSSSSSLLRDATTTDPSTNDEPQQKIVSITGYNRFMVQSMTDSLKIPHMGLGDEINVDKLLRFRQEWKASQQADDNGGAVKLGMQTLLIKACSLALKEYPQVNAKTHDAEKCQVCYCTNHDIGIAMDTPHGLVVPVIRNVQNLSLIEIQREVNRLKQAAASGSTKLQDLSPGPTFVLSNIGAVGVGTHMSPVLVPPMIAMGALGRIQRLPRFGEDDKVVAVNVLYASWAADHRFLDGATLARFHKSFAKYASDPILMLPHLK